MYYKVKMDNEVIDVISHIMFARIINKAICTSDAEHATGFLSSDYKKVYHIDGAPDGEYYPDGNAVLEETTQEEATLLKEVLASGAAVEDQDGEDVVVDEEPEPDPVAEMEEANAALESFREWKLKQLSDACRNTIESGFTEIIHNADGEKIYSYSLKEDDQINILMNMDMIMSGAESVIYHANSEPARVYLADDFKKLAMTANYCRMYNTSYFNCLKMWVNDLTDKVEIGKITYGSVVPDDYQTEAYVYICDVLKKIDTGYSFCNHEAGAE